MSNINKHGLSRHIPSEIRRQVRKECGFGCVVCGHAIAQYEHIDPVFEEAQIHEVSKIAYLCGGCHDNVTRGFWSKSKIKKARENPITFKNGVSSHVFDVEAPFNLRIGSNNFTNIETFFAFRYSPLNDSVYDKLIYVEPPEENGAPFRLTGRFYDAEGKQLIAIRENELLVPNRLWDIEATARKFTIRSKSNYIAFQLVVEPPHQFIITRIDMLYKGIKMSLTEKGDLKIGSENYGTMIFSNTTLGSGKIALLLQ